MIHLEELKVLLSWKARGFIWTLNKPLLSSLTRNPALKQKELTLLLCFCYKMNLLLETASAGFLQFHYSIEESSDLKSESILQCKRQNGNLV